jgi:hypothetical protein
MSTNHLRRILTVAILFALLGSSLLVRSGGAEGPQPPQPPGYATPPPPPPYPPDGPGEGEGNNDGGISPQAVPLGQPGTSFRYLRQFGVTEEPYLADGSHLNQPNGIFIDASDHLYVTEERGSRVLKFDVSGPTPDDTSSLTIGAAGLAYGHEGYLYEAHDVAVRSIDSHIWTANNPSVKEFDASGNFLRSIPAVNPWESGDDNEHFNNPFGIRFGAGGYLYVSDHFNHRIQVYDVTTDPPTHIATIGTTGQPQSDNTGFNRPFEIAFDSLGRLYVVDFANNRVQRCTSSNPWTAWTCTTFFGETGVPGSDLTHMGWAVGLGIDSADNIFLADGSNGRVLKCNTSGICAVFVASGGGDNTTFSFLVDVEADSSGDVYIVDEHNHRVQKFNSAGVYQATIGVSHVPYLTNATRMNNPWGVAVAPDGSIYYTENTGYRLVKLNAAGVKQWSVGQAGVFGNDNGHFDRLEGNPAVGAAGRLHVPDTGNNRVQIFNPNGTYFDTLGTGGGQGDYQFNCPAGVAINPTNGDIVVADKCNNRVQVFTSGQVYKATLGVTAQAGSDNYHFAAPWGVAVDASGDIYVADFDNFRVQKCALIPGSYTCSTFAGAGTDYNGDFSHVRPVSVAVGSDGLVYVADDWGSRVQVYSPLGEYLTTIGGNWGPGAGDMRWTRGVAVDTAGNVYVSDPGFGQRIQKFARGYPNWVQTNINGFGNRWNLGIWSMATFNNRLYAATRNDGGSQLWRSINGKTWYPVTGAGIGNSQGIVTMLAFNGYLYAGSDEGGVQLYRSADGRTWEWTTPDGLDASTNGGFSRLGVHANKLYVGTWTDPAVHGAEIWRSATGGSSEWTQVVADGFGDSNNNGVPTFHSFGGYLYAGTYNPVTGGELWRTAAGGAGTWNQVNTDGFGDPDNDGISALAGFGGYLYAATAYGSATEIWRCQVCDGSDWTQVVGDGFGDPENDGRTALEPLNDYLYVVVGNRTDDGLGVWRTRNGTTWQQVASKGFGTRSNEDTKWDGATIAFNGQLYVGTSNFANGGQIWRAKLRTTLALNSTAAQDGWVLESGENTNIGGSLDGTATALRLGDDAARKQYRGILSFGTGVLPDNATITKVTLTFKQQGVTGGGNPFTIFQGLFTDWIKGTFGTASLQVGDFQATPGGTLGPYSPTPSSGLYTIVLPNSVYPLINKLATGSGLTQVRLRFKLDDNNNGIANFLSLFSGNNATGKPRLLIEYYVP